MSVLLLETIEAAVAVTVVDGCSLVGREEGMVGANLSRSVLYRGSVVVVVVDDEDDDDVDDDDDGESKQGLDFSKRTSSLSESYHCMCGSLVRTALAVGHSSRDHYYYE